MAKNLMIQGTMSGAGKSILTAGILRVLRQDGYRVAPFKSQNMALNSFVTADGREMGRAQALQAAAAGMEPSADMNPILLKPMGDTTSQVIVNGRPIGNMRAADYFRIKKQMIPEILHAYERLSERADIIVIEGAGSPVEINLRSNDIVNMGLAEMLDAPVLLVGNIDPGGVFAQLLGTVQLMSEEERKRVKGLIINKFRGDVSLLTPGLSMFKEYCEIPFAGVVPFVPLDLDEEDSVSERLMKRPVKASTRGSEVEGQCFDSAARAPGGCENGECRNGGCENEHSIKISVIRLPFISNYTDFAPLETIQGVELVYAREERDLEGSDLIILPGTKNTIHDLGWLAEVGLDEAIRREKEKGTLIIGICGGFQMLGRSIDDRGSYEGGGICEGLGFLPIDTVFNGEKTLRQTTGQVGRLQGAYSGLSGLTVSGYEIHMGVCRMDAAAGATEEPALPVADTPEGAPEEPALPVADTPAGAPEKPSFPVISEGNVLGTYLHGIFDSADFCRKLLSIISERKGLGAFEVELEDAAVRQNRELDKLADVLRGCLDFDLIYRVIGVGGSGAGSVDQSLHKGPEPATQLPHQGVSPTDQLLHHEIGSQVRPSNRGPVSTIQPLPQHSSPRLILPSDIEKESFRIIKQELTAMGKSIPAEFEPTVLRVIHTTADFEYADTLAFSDGAIEKARDAIRRGAHIVTDTNMALSGISKKALSKYGGEVHCFMADEEVARIARSRQVTRAYVSMEKAAEIGGPLVFAIGNAPTALIRLRELFDEKGFRPELIIGVPVGFVNVIEAKNFILETDIPFIINNGRKGGSGVAAAICNSILYNM